jgi:ABC-type branched-subunit amino acid transport system substrate-binding protein
MSQLDKNKCMRENLKDILLSDDFNNLQIQGSLGIIGFEQNGDRLDPNGELGVVVEAKNGNFEFYNPENTP